MGIWRKLICGVLAAAMTAQPAFAMRTLIRDAEIEDTLERLSQPLLRAAGIAEREVQVLIVQDPAINAFAASPRVIVLHTGLLIRFPRPEALAGVIAHEIGHLTGGHHARRAIEARNLRGPAAIAVLLGIAAAAAGGGAAGAALGGLGTEAVRRNFLAYTRSEEASADQAGVSYMNRAGLDPSGMLDVLSYFQGQDVFNRSRVDPRQLTHPLSAERLSLLRERVAESPARGASTPPDIAYRYARMRAKLDGFLGRPENVLRKADDAADPGSEPNLLRRAVAQFRMADDHAALQTMDILLKQRPRDPYYWDLRGQILFESARPAEAAEAWRKALDFAPEEPLIAGALGRALLAAGRDAEALPVLERAAAKDDASPGLYRDLAVAYGRAGREGEAALASAERLTLTGRTRDAAALARRAQGLLKRGSPEWRRAEDIIDLARLNK